MAITSSRSDPGPDRFPRKGRNGKSALMRAMMNLLYAIHTALWSAFWIAAALAARLLTGDTAVSLAMARRFWARGLLRAGGMRVEVEGLDNLDPRQAYFFAANHQSLLDVVALYEALPVPLLFIVKEELRRVPFLGWYMSAMGMVYIRRRQQRQSLEAMQLCARRIAEGRSIVIFPEGTRSHDGTLGAFKPGAFIPPIDAGATVVPVAIDGTAAVLPAGGFRVHPGRIRLGVGRPIATAGLERRHRRELARQVREQVMVLLQSDRRRI